MAAGAGVFAGMLVGTVVAAARGPALLARAQVNPPGVDLDTLIAFAPLRRPDLSNLPQMRAGRIRYH